MAFVWYFEAITACTTVSFHKFCFNISIAEAEKHLQGQVCTSIIETLFNIFSNHNLQFDLINPLYWFFGSEGHVALDYRNLGPGFNTLLLRLIPGDLLSACPHRQFHTLPCLLDSRAVLSNSYLNVNVPSREAVRMLNTTNQLTLDCMIFEKLFNARINRKLEIEYIIIKIIL